MSAGDIPNIQALGSCLYTLKVTFILRLLHTILNVTCRLVS